MECWTPGKLHILFCYVTKVSTYPNETECEIVNGVNSIRVPKKHSCGIQMVELNALVLRKLSRHINHFSMKHLILRAFGSSVCVLFRQKGMIKKIWHYSRQQFL